MVDCQPHLLVNEESQAHAFDFIVPFSQCQAAGSSSTTSLGGTAMEKEDSCHEEKLLLLIDLQNAVPHWVVNTISSAS